MATASGSNTALAARLAEQARPQAPAAKPANTIEELLEKYRPQLQKALPSHVKIDRLARVALSTINQNPDLRKCSAQSLLVAVMRSAQLGLEPNLLGHAYFVPFWNSKTQSHDVQFIIGYRGLLDLARRSGNIQSINAHEVYANDLFELEYGLEEKLRHIPWHLRDDLEYVEPGEFRGAYMVAKFKPDEHGNDGGYHLHYMSKAEIDAHRERSKAAQSGPWVSDYVEMAKKTVIRSAWKWLPISIEIADQVARDDESVKSELTPDSDLETIIIEVPREETAATTEDGL